MLITGLAGWLVIFLVSQNAISQNTIWHMPICYNETVRSITYIAVIIGMLIGHVVVSNKSSPTHIMSTVSQFAVRGIPWKHWRHRIISIEMSVIEFPRSVKILVLSLHSRVRAHLWLEQVDIEHGEPGVMLRKGIVKLGSDSLHLGKSGAWDVGEVMMLHMVAHIEGNVVPRSVVGVGLITSFKHVVLGYEVSGHGVDTHTQ